MLNLRTLVIAAGLAVGAQSALGQSCDITVATMNNLIDTEVADLNALIADGQTGWIPLRNDYVSFQVTYLTCPPTNNKSQRFCELAIEMETVMTPTFKNNSLSACP